MSRQRWQVLPIFLIGLSSMAGCNRLADVAQRAAAEESRQAQSKKGEEPTSDKEGFRFPDDKGGALLARVLPPTEPATPVEKTAPRRQSPPASMEAPMVPLAPVVVSLPRVPLNATRPALLPHLVVEETLEGAAAPALPQARPLPTGEKSHVASADVNKPMPLPLLARPVTDRASLEDPTTEASAAAATAATVPQRTNPVPFQRLSVPDPFENRGTIQLKETPAEDTTPPLASPRTPGR